MDWMGGEKEQVKLKEEDMSHDNIDNQRERQREREKERIREGDRQRERENEREEDRVGNRQYWRYRALQCTSFNSERRSISFYVN